MDTPYHTCLLTNRTVVKASGKDAEKLLQGLLSCNIEQLSEGQLAYGFLLTPQGRFLHEFFVFKDGADLYLDTQADAAEALLKRLKLYTLRSEATFLLLDSWAVMAAPNEVDSLTHAYKDPRHESLGVRAYGDAETIAPLVTANTMDGYETNRISLGIPCSADFEAEKTLLLDYDVDLLGGVDFEKGCYVGQEVTARMHYRAMDKKGLYIISPSDASAELPDTGAEILLGEKTAGKLLSRTSKQAIGLLRHEHVGGTLLANGCTLNVTRPSWVTKETV